MPDSSPRTRTLCRETTDRRYSSPISVTVGMSAPRSVPSGSMMGFAAISEMRNVTSSSESSSSPSCRFPVRRMRSVSPA